MTTFLHAAVVSLFSFLSISGSVQATEGCDEFSTYLTTTPVPPQSSSGLKDWARIRPTSKSSPDVLLLGDSLAGGWPQNLAIKDNEWTFLNIGVGRDRTQNTLWRLDDMAHNLVTPSRLVVMIGTNNLNDPDPTACSIAKGSIAVVSKARQLWPSVKVYLYPIPPRGHDFKFRNQIRLDVNAELEAWSASIEDVHFVKIDENEFTCGIYDQPAVMSPNSCVLNEPCKFYREDNVHISVDGYRYLSALLPW